MNINIDQSKTPSAHTSGTGSTGKVAGVYNSNAGSLKSVVAGEILTGEISAVRGREVQITLGNEQIITARLTQDISLSLGQMMSFRVKSSSGSQIALTPLMENMAQDSAAMKAIQASGIPMNETTLAMTSAMMDEGMPIHRESLQALFRIVNANEGANPVSIVKMTNLALPITPETIEQFEMYQNHQHQISGMVEELAGEFQKLSMEGDIPVNQKVLDIFTGKSNPTLQQELLEGMNTTEQSEVEVVVEEPKTPQTLGDIMKELELEKAQIPSEKTVEDKPPMEALVVEEADTELGTMLDGKERLALAEHMQDMGMGQKQAELILNGQMEPSQVLEYAKALMELSGENPELASRLKEMIAGKEFQTLLKNEIEKQWMLTPEDVEDKAKVTELYKKILSQTDRTLQLLSQIGKGDSVLAKGTEGLRQNVNFLNQLNQIFAYVQLPLKMSQENAHGDLYVYTKKRSLSKEDDSCTALLHLEMERLGTMDIHVALKNGNEVKTHFYLQKEEMLDFIEANIDKLDENLRKRGYATTTGASVRTPATAKTNAETENMVLDEMIGNREGKRMVAKYSFDVRA